MKRYQTGILKRFVCICVLIALGVFVFMTAFWSKRGALCQQGLKTKTVSFAVDIKEKAVLQETAQEIKRAELSKTKEAQKAEELTETIKTSKVHMKRAFERITIQQLDESEDTADDVSTQYWKNNLLFLGRDGEFALYGINEEGDTRGLIVRKSDSLFFIDEYYCSPTLVYPMVFAGDFDKDGETEAAVILHRLTGTGFSREELFIMDETEQENTSDWSRNIFYMQDYLRQVEENLCIEVFNDTCQVHLFTVDNNQDIWVDLSDELVFINGEVVVLENKMILGDLVQFDVEEETLKIAITVGLKSKQSAIPLYSASLPVVEAKVSYQGGSFQIINMEFHEAAN